MAQAGLRGTPAGSPALAAGTRSEVLESSTTQLLDLGEDELMLVASWCGRSAPLLAHACRATQGVWQRVKRDTELLARVLVATSQQPGAGGISAAACSRRCANGSALEQLFASRQLPRVVTDADAMQMLLPELDRYAAQHPEAAAQEQEALLWAVSLGHVATASVLLARGSVKNFRQLLLRAASDNRVRVLEVLLAHGPVLKADVERAVKLAAVWGHAAIVRLLVERWEGPPLQLRQEVEAAMKASNLELLEALVCRGLGFRADREFVLLHAADTDPGDRYSLGILELLLRHVGATPQEMGPALVAAVRRRQPGLVSALLQAGADVHHDGDRALLLAATADASDGKWRMMVLVQELLEHGAAAAAVLPAAHASGANKAALKLLEKHAGVA